MIRYLNLIIGKNDPATCASFAFVRLGYCPKWDELHRIFCALSDGCSVEEAFAVVYGEMA